MHVASRVDRDRIAAYVRGRLHLRVVSDNVQDTYNAFDRGLRDELRNTGTGTLCKPACSACCDQLVIVTTGEASIILQRFPEVVLDVMPRIDANVAAFEKLCAEQGFQQEALDFVNRPDLAEERERLHNAWYATRTPCVFLDRATHRCRVYSARPAACRSHTLVDRHGQHPSMCDDRTGETRLTFFHSNAYGPLLQRLSAVMEEHYGAHAMGLLPGMICHAVLRELRHEGPKS